MFTSEENHAVSESLKKEAETVDTSLRLFLERYKMTVEDMYEEQAKAYFDAWHDTPEVNPSPIEKQLSFVYTQAIFKKFQVEVLGAATCHLKIEKEDGSSITHTIVVLQISGVFTIPVKYVLQRWTNAAASRIPLSEKLENVQTKIRRLNDLCRRAIIVEQVVTRVPIEPMPNLNANKGVKRAVSGKEKSKNDGLNKLPEVDLPNLRLLQLHNMMPPHLQGVVPAMFHNVASTQYHNVMALRYLDASLVINVDKDADTMIKLLGIYVIGNLFDGADSDGTDPDKNVSSVYQNIGILQICFV
ncbi:hypothetical protein Tco_1197046 [Tanacetum coccineum]